MTRLAKILTIFTTAACLGFAAFAMAMFAGGPNWTVMANSQALTPRVEFAVSDTGTHSAKLRVTGDQIATSEVQADVVLKAQARVLADFRNELQDLQAKIATLEPQRETVRTQVAADLGGLARHAELWTAQLTDISNRIAEMTNQLAMTGTNAVQLQEELKELRFEVLRLRNQLELLRDDQFAAEEQQRALEAELLLLRESRLRLERRQQGLKQQLSGTNY